MVAQPCRNGIGATELAMHSLHDLLQHMSSSCSRHALQQT